MPYTTNIHDFQTFKGSELVESYLILIAIELALKDCGATSGESHNIPNLLESLLQFTKVSKHPKIPSDLASHVAQLRASLSAIWCNNADGKPDRVPSKSYPHLRYCRFYMEWENDRETKATDIFKLNATCKALREFLRKNKSVIGIKL
jgi:hypothetical protein